MNSIISRFAPSPTGNLHIGGVRTALINFIITKQAKKKFPNSKFLLRIEDTDTKRSSENYKISILNGLKWMGLNFDEEPFIQSSKIKRHQEIALELLKKNKAFKCICSPKDLEKIRIENRSNKNNNKRLCKNCEKNSEIQSLNENYVIRIKIPEEGKILINDLIQGSVKVSNKEIDDFVLLRNDGSPTYMLSVVVDDHDMGVNFILRGDDHFNNVFKQNYIYNYMEWPVPTYAHLPLIHGNDGKKLSKRHGAVDINNFKNDGYLKESIINNLILLGWSTNKDSEIINLNEIIEMFKIENISKSSSIFSYDKLNFFNNYYIKNDIKNNKIINYLNEHEMLKKYLKVDSEKISRLILIYKGKINFYKELENIIPIYFQKELMDRNNKILNNEFNVLINDFYEILLKIDDWNIVTLEIKIKNFIEQKSIKFSIFGKPTRIILINKEQGPSISDILYILGKKNSIVRIKNYISK